MSIPLLVSISDHHIFFSCPWYFTFKMENCSWQINEDNLIVMSVAMWEIMIWAQSSEWFLKLRMGFDLKQVIIYKVSVHLKLFRYSVFIETSVYFVFEALLNMLETLIGHDGDILSFISMLYQHDYPRTWFFWCCAGFTGAIFAKKVLWSQGMLVGID